MFKQPSSGKVRQENVMNYVVRFGKKMYYLHYAQLFRILIAAVSLVKPYWLSGWRYFMQLHYTYVSQSSLMKLEKAYTGYFILKINEGL